MSSLTKIDGLPVVNAKTPLRLHVTATDIAHADTKEPGHCAVARACRRELHAIEARIHLGRVYVRMNRGNWVRYLTPRAMRSEIIAFDRGGSFEPGEFTLLPAKSKAATGKRQGGRDKSPTGGRGKKRGPYHIVTNVRGGPAA